MSNKAASAWLGILNDLAGAADAGTLESSLMASLGLRQLHQLNLPSATFKKLVKEHKMALLVGKAFATSAHKDPLLDATSAAGAVLDLFLSKAQDIVCHAPKGQLPAPFSSPAAAGSLAAEVSRQLQQSGVLQQLPRALTAVAQQLEASAADPNAPADAWHMACHEGRAAIHSSSTQAHARVLLQSFMRLTSLCDTQLTQQLLAAAAPPAARTCLLLLRAVSAAMQLYDPRSPTDGKGMDLMGEYAAAVQTCGQVLITAAHKSVNDPHLVDKLWVQDTHIYQFNIALAAAASLKLQHDCSTASSSTSGSSRAAGSSTSSSSSSRRAGGPSNPNSAAQQASNPQLNGGAGDPARCVLAAADAWQRSCEVISSLGTGLQQLLFEQQGVDPRVALWAICSLPTEEGIWQGQASAILHQQLFTARANRAREQWLQPCEQQQEGQQLQAQQQQPGQQQEGRQQRPPEWPLEFCLNLLLVSVMTPGRLTPQHMFTPVSGWTPFKIHLKLLPLLTCLPEDTRAAAAAAAAAALPNMGLQGLLLQDCLEELLHSLLLVSRNLAVLTRQQQAAAAGAAAGSGTSSSSIGSNSSAGGARSGSHAAGLADDVAEGTMFVAGMLYLILQACTADLGPAAAVVVDQGSKQQGGQQQQQQSFVELLRPRLAKIVAHFDSCARAIAANMVSTASPGTCSDDYLETGLAACSRFVRQGIQTVVGLASKSGFHSRELRQLFSLQASLLKMSANVRNGNGISGSSMDDSEQRARACTLGAAHAAATVILQAMDGLDDKAEAAAAYADTAGTPDQQQQQLAATTALRLLPSLAIFGRACLQWAQELREQVQQGQQTEPSVLQPACFAAKVCCSGFEPLAWLTGDTGSAQEGTNSLLFLLDMFQLWLCRQHVSAQLAAAGYEPQQLQQQLKLLSNAPAAVAAAAAIAVATGQQPMAQVLQPLVEQLQVVGTALSSLAVPAFCNNPACSNVSGPTEVLLVSGRSCICAGCRRARYCSRACIQQHWKAHKPVCQALAAAAAAAAVGK